MEAILREHAHLGARGSQIVVARLREEIVCLEKVVEKAGPLEKMVRDLRKELDEVKQQRNGLRQQLRNTQEHRGRLSQQILEAQDISLQVLRDCVREIDRVPAQGVQQLVRAINDQIQHVLEEEGEDIIEVTPEPKIDKIGNFPMALEGVLAVTAYW
ncbi:unnamed protein product [Closterium sp. Yama58-4]|nr:unnamed protein product [Closterium sp. Yama58-4]